MIIRLELESWASTFRVPQSVLCMSGNDLDQGSSTNGNGNGKRALPSYHSLGAAILAQVHRGDTWCLSGMPRNLNTTAKKVACLFCQLCLVHVPMGESTISRFPQSISSNCSHEKGWEWEPSSLPACQPQIALRRTGRRFVSNHFIQRQQLLLFVWGFRLFLCYDFAFGKRNRCAEWQCKGNYFWHHTFG